MALKLPCRSFICKSVMLRSGRGQRQANSMASSMRSTRLVDWFLTRNVEKTTVQVTKAISLSYSEDADASLPLAQMIVQCRELCKLGLAGVPY